MGVLNVTPDSFYDGGRYENPSDVLRRVEAMVERVLPVVRMITKRFDVPVSVDTYKSNVARRALEEGAEIVNDISGLRFDAAMAEIIARYGAGVVAMHIRGTPQTMQLNTEYDDLLGEIRTYLEESVKLAEAAGIQPECVVVDPGIGFGKTIDDNYTLIRSIALFREIGRPVLVGPSRKSFLWKVLGTSPEDALEGTLSAAIFSYLNGADLLRVHDIGPVRRALVIARCFQERKNGQ
jgi:dihydropteroate synthase